jgi:hypothetical protein
MYWNFVPYKMTETKLKSPSFVYICSAWSHQAATFIMNALKTAYYRCAWCGLSLSSLGKWRDDEWRSVGVNNIKVAAGVL